MILVSYHEAPSGAASPTPLVRVSCHNGPSPKGEFFCDIFFCDVRALCDRCSELEIYLPLRPVEPSSSVFEWIKEFEEMEASKAKGFDTDGR